MNPLILLSLSYDVMKSQYENMIIVSARRWRAITTPTTTATTTAHPKQGAGQRAGPGPGRLTGVRSTQCE